MRQTFQYRYDFSKCIDKTGHNFLTDGIFSFLGFPAQHTGGEDYCFYSGSFFFLFFFFFFFCFLLSPLARKR
jgi:hypothetical protein